MQLKYPRELLDELGPQERQKIAAIGRETLDALADVVFFTSLRVEERESVAVAVVYHEGGAGGLAAVRDTPEPPVTEDEPTLGWSVTTMEPRPLTPGNLAKLSRGLRYGSQLAIVGGRESNLHIDGIARRRRFANGGEVLRLAAPRPGSLVFEYERRQLFRFESGERAPYELDVFAMPNPVRAAIGKITRDSFDGDEALSFTEHSLVALLRGMRDTRAGGILALLPSEPDGATLTTVPHRRQKAGLLRDAIAQDKYVGLRAVTAGYLGPGRRPRKRDIREIRSRQQAAEEAEHELDAALDEVAQLSAIDGAVLGGPQLSIYGAGYIVPQLETTPTVRLAVDVHGEVLEELPLHGARHSAAIDFAYSNPGGVAIVVSEDGPTKCALRRGDTVIVWPIRISET